MATLTLEPTAPRNTGPQSGNTGGLSNAVLYNDARWFIGIRWFVAAVFIVFGLVCAFIPGLLATTGIQAPGRWPWTLGFIIATANVINMAWLSRLKSSVPTTRTRIKANIWFQIVTDLLVLTALIHLLGTVDTVAPFAYLFHISLACIFFGRRESFLVLLISTALFLTAVLLDASGRIAHTGFLLPELRRAHGFLPTAIFSIPAVFIWGVVWFLVSSLSDDVRKRDDKLERANRRILLADEEINRQMLRVTHDLKAPFSGIETNIEMLKMLHWNDLSEPARGFLEKIDARSASLRLRIGDILLLGNLRSAPPGGNPAFTPVSLRKVLLAVISDVQALADTRQVSIVIADGDTQISSDMRQLRILFLNLISNAVTYSRQNGVVKVSIIADSRKTGVRVEDQGIGITPEALPHIFEDFYRAPEATGVNPNSTGLGLAIIRQVAQNIKLTVTVESEPGMGTVFEVFRKAGSTLNSTNDQGA